MKSIVRELLNKLHTASVESNSKSSHTLKFESLENREMLSATPYETGADVTEATTEFVATVVAERNDVIDLTSVANNEETGETGNVNVQQLESVTVKGTRAIGKQLAAVMTPSNATATYQWYRGSGDEWTAIEGATGRAYTQTADDFGCYVKVVATGTGDFSGEVEAQTSKATMSIIGQPSLEGDAYVSKTLTAVLAESDANAIVTYTWYRGSEKEGWTRIAGETSNEYVLTEADVDQYVKVVVTGRDGYTDFKEAVTSSAVDYLASLESVTIKGTRAIGKRLAATVAPEGATATFQWYRGEGDDWTAIEGATKATYIQVAEDFGCYVKVVATGTGLYSGEVEAQTSKATMSIIGQPSLEGDAYVSKTLTAVLAESDANAIVTYTWYRGSEKEGWTRIAGETSNEYVLTEADVDQYVKVVVTGRDGYTDFKEAVTASTVAQPTELESVSVKGTRAVGKTLTATVAPAGATVEYQWLRVDSEGVETAIDGATSRFYVQTEEDFGAYLKVVATGTGAFVGEVDAQTTKATMTIIAAPVLEGNLTVGETLSVNIGSASATVTYNWYRGNDQDGWTRIAGATAGEYELTDADEGLYIKVLVTGHDGYTDFKETVSSDVVAAATESGDDDPESGNDVVTNALAFAQLATTDELEL
ncbi:MAG: hypothetical protein Q4G03_11905 [Planctomycetia bacterium]|nr:hypothetical protein [Planctomycetia bacterium]